MYGYDEFSNSSGASSSGSSAVTVLRRWSTTYLDNKYDSISEIYNSSVDVSTCISSNEAVLRIKKYEREKYETHQRYLNQLNLFHFEPRSWFAEGKKY